MSVSLEKIPGVQSVHVSLKEGKASIALKPGNTVSLDAVREAVTKDGFNPEEAEVTARGEPVVGDGSLQLKITGPNVAYDVQTSDRAVQQGLRSMAGRTVTVKAVVPPPKDKMRVIKVNTFSQTK